MRIGSLVMVSWLGLAACSAKRAPLPAPPAVPALAASRYSEADSASVFESVAHELLFFDEARESVERKFPPRRVPDSEPLVFVRIGALPAAAWAAPAVARLRNRRWFMNWTAVDSSRALAGLEDRPGARWRKPIPISLEMRVDFSGDSALVAENWLWDYCKTEPRSRSVVRLKTHLFERTASGWHKSGVRYGLADLACFR